MMDYKEVALRLMFAFDRVRRYGIINELELGEELREYLTDEELNEMTALYREYSNYRKSNV